MTITLISVEQASYLDVALQTRRANEPLPPCPACGRRPGQVRARHDIRAGCQLVFVDCEHVIGLDMSTYDDWCATADTNPWVEMFEEHSHQQQLRTRG